MKIDMLIEMLSSSINHEPSHKAVSVTFKDLEVGGAYRVGNFRWTVKPFLGLQETLTCDGTGKEFGEGIPSAVLYKHTLQQD